jgi:hypothetical protein
MTATNTIRHDDPGYIGWLLTTSNKAVERAIVAIYHRQTLDEQRSETTIHTNGVGFSGADVRTGTYYAKWILSGKRLTGKFLDRARVMAHKYMRQLVDIAHENEERKSLLEASERVVQVIPERGQRFEVMGNGTNNVPVDIGYEEFDYSFEIPDLDIPLE